MSNFRLLVGIIALLQARSTLPTINPMAHVIQNRPIWQDYACASLKVGGKLIPGVSHAIDVVQDVNTRREGVERHAQMLSEISRVERSVEEVIEAR